MKKIICLAVFLFTSNSFGWYPSSSESELRIIASSSTSKALAQFSSWDISGQILQKKINEKHQIGFMYELGLDDHEGKVGTHYTYSINHFVDVAVAGDLSQLKNIGSSFWINLNLNIKDFDFKPFVSISHKTVTEWGFVVYKKYKNALFNVGLAFSPDHRIIGDNEKKDQKVVLVFGTTIDSLTPFIHKDKE